MFNEEISTMKRIIYIWTLLLFPFCLNAQSSTRAAEILDKVVVLLSDKEGIRINFAGTENGSLLIKENKFYLKSNQVQSWYDGTTQWSYVSTNEEVNVSTPTPEELQHVNPYFILKRYKTDYHYAYRGNLDKRGTQGHEIVLTPKSGNTEMIHVGISNDYQPLFIKIEQNGRVVSDIHVTSFQTNQRLEDNMFRFNKSLYPDAEIIDLR